MKRSSRVSVPGESYRSTKKHKTPMKHLQLDREFLEIWNKSRIFCEEKKGKRSWHLTPYLEFLAEKFSKGLSSTRIEGQAEQEDRLQHSNSERRSSEVSTSTIA